MHLCILFYTSGMPLIPGERGVMSKRGHERRKRREKEVDTNKTNNNKIKNKGRN